MSADRRAFLKRVAGGTAAISWVALAAPTEASAQAAPDPGYVSFSPAEAAFVEALVNVMCPADALTPSGVDCGLAAFIDRQLAGGFGRGDRLYRQGPWRTGKPQLGYQSPLTPEQFFKSGIAAVQAASQARFGKPYEALAIEEADALLQDVAAGKVADARVPLATWFNELAYPLFVQACFADPLYGGNRGKAFWKLVGYPALPAFHTQNMTLYRGKRFPGAADPKSISDFS